MLEGFAVVEVIFGLTLVFVYVIVIVVVVMVVILREVLVLVTCMDVIYLQF